MSRARVRRRGARAKRLLTRPLREITLVLLCARADEDDGVRKREYNQVKIKYPRAYSRHGPQRSGIKCAYTRYGSQRVKHPATQSPYLTQDRHVLLRTYGTHSPLHHRKHHQHYTTRDADNDSVKLPFASTSSKSSANITKCLTSRRS